MSELPKSYDKYQSAKADEEYKPITVMEVPNITAMSQQEGLSIKDETPDQVEIKIDDVET